MSMKRYQLARIGSLYFTRAALPGPQGVAVVRLLIDTGSTFTVVPVEVLEAVGCSPATTKEHVRIATASGYLIALRVSVRRPAARLLPRLLRQRANLQTPNQPRFQRAQERGRVQRLVRAHFTFGTPRSLQILLARLSSISLCLGTAERVFLLRLCHQECLRPSRSNSQPCLRRCRRSSSLFILRWALPQNPRQQPQVPRGD